MPPHTDSYLATEPLGETRAGEIIRGDVAVSDTKFVIDYYRLSADKRLLFGGGETYRRAFPADIKGCVRKYMLRVYPQLAGARIDYAWGAGRWRSPATACPASAAWGRGCSTPRASPATAWP